MGGSSRSRRRRSSRRRGFTLIELATVIALMALMTACIVPSFITHLRRARVADAIYNLQTIGSLEQSYRFVHGAFRACAAAPTEVPRGNARAWSGNEGFETIGFRGTDPVFYQFEVALDGSGYRAIARGDLDGDGLSSEMTLRSSDPQVQVERELE